MVLSGDFPAMNLEFQFAASKNPHFHQSYWLNNCCSSFSSLHDGSFLIASGKEGHPLAPVK
jgi:hypothetical protein